MKRVVEEKKTERVKNVKGANCAPFRLTLLHAPLSESRAWSNRQTNPLCIYLTLSFSHMPSHAQGAPILTTASYLLPACTKTTPSITPSRN